MADPDALKALETALAKRDTALVSAPAPTTFTPKEGPARGFSVIPGDVSLDLGMNGFGVSRLPQQTGFDPGLEGFGSAGSTPIVADRDPGQDVDLGRGALGTLVDIGKGVLGAERGLGQKLIRGFEGAVQTLITPPGRPNVFGLEDFQFQVGQRGGDKVDLLLTEAGMDSALIRDWMSRDVGAGGFRGDDPERRQEVLTVRTAQDIFRQAERAVNQPGGIGEAIGQMLGDLITLGQGLPQEEKEQFVSDMFMFTSAGVFAGPAGAAILNRMIGFGTTATRAAFAGFGARGGTGLTPSTVAKTFAQGYGSVIRPVTVATTPTATRVPGHLRGRGSVPTTPTTAERARKAAQRQATDEGRGGQADDYLDRLDAIFRREVPAGGAAEATQFPEVVRSLEQAWQFRRIDRPTSFGQFLEQIPGLKQMIHIVRRANKIPEQIQVAHIAQGSTRSEFAADAFASRVPLMRQIDDVFGPGAAEGANTNVRFIGTADDIAINPGKTQIRLEGTVLDIAQRPFLYELNAAQKALLSQWERRNQKLLTDIQKGYGSSIGTFAPPPGGVFLANVDIAEDLLEAVGTTVSQAAQTGRAKTRVFATAAERMKSDSDFKPITSIVQLQSGMDNGKAVMASNQVFKGGTGGLTRTQVVDLTHPTLRKRRDNMATMVQSLEDKIARAEAASTKASRAAKASTRRMVKMDQKAVLLLDSIEALGEDLGAELPLLARQVKALQGRSEVLQSKILHLRDEAAFKGIKANGLMPELEDAAQFLQELRVKYEGANLKGFQFVEEPVWRYFPDEDAKAVRDLVKQTDNTFVRLLDDIRGTAFAGDFSPITGIQLPLFALFHPKAATEMLIGAGKNSLQSKDLLRSFRTDTFVKVVGDDLQGWRDLAYFSGLDIQTGTPTEFAGGLLRYIPGFTKANERMFSVVLRVMKSSYDIQLKRLARRGIIGDHAKALAADGATMVVPIWNPTRLGLSGRRAATLRSIPTSVSFLLRPATLVTQATTGFAKMALGKKLAPQEVLAIELMLTYAATTEVISITTAVASALVLGNDPWEAAERAANPLSPKFGDLIIGNRRIPLGGPYRGIIRMIMPREVDWAPIPVPFANIGNFVRNRIGPGLQVPFRLAENQDFQKGKIRKGHFPQQILQSLMFAAEGTVPLTLGAAIGGVRRELPVGDIAEEVVGQLFGTNIGKETPFQERNVNVTRWAKEQNLDYKVESYFDLGAQRNTKNNWISDRNRYDAAFPEEVEGIKREQARRVRQGIPIAVERGHLEEAATNRLREEEALVAELQLPPDDPNHATLDEFREGYSDIQAKAAHDRAATSRDFQLFQEKRELPKDPRKRAIVEYYDAFDKSRTASGRLIFERLDEELASLEKQWTEDQNQWVKENTGLITDHPPLVQEYLIDRDREDVKKWRLMTSTVMGDNNLLAKYYDFLGSDDKAAFQDQNVIFDDMLALAQDQKDDARRKSFDLERILYKWGWIDSPLNSHLESLVQVLRAEQGGVVTDRHVIDKQIAEVAP